MVFHHINSDEKDFGISASGKYKTFESIKEELDKCILLCSNCHGEIHDKENKAQIELKREELEKLRK